MAPHAKFSPSKMEQIILCPGSVALSSRVEDSRSSYADEGTGAHYVAALCLTNDEDAAHYVGNTFDVDDHGEVIWAVEEKGKFKVDQAFASAVQIYVDEVRRRAYGKTMMVEQRVEFSNTVNVKDQFGTSDAIVIDVDNQTLELGDLKFGMGVKVYAENNSQMLTYAAAVLETFEEVLPTITKFKLFICQPRLDHIDEWECDRATIDKHIASMRNAVVEATVALSLYENDREINPAFFRAGEKQCRWCKAKAFCPTLRQSIAKACTDDFKAFDDEQSVDLVTSGPPLRPSSPALLGRLYGTLDMVSEWVKAVRSETERMVLSGMEVIGPDGLRMKLVEGKKGNRTWVDEKKAEALLLGHLPPDKVYEPQCVITASAAAKLLDKKKTAATWENFKPLITQADGKPTVVLGSDPRPSWVDSASSSEFGDVS